MWTKYSFQPQTLIWSVLNLSGLSFASVSISRLTIFPCIPKPPRAKYVFTSAQNALSPDFPATADGCRIKSRIAESTSFV